jgi:glutamine amidotransferase
MIAIIDYGVGNLFSLKSSFKAIGEEATVTNDINVIHNAHRIILPGVGAFEDAARKLNDSGMAEVLLNEFRSGKPIMGICLGMQLLFERSFEFGVHKGLGIINGDIVSFEGKIDKDFRIPHIGWNSLKLYNNSPLFCGLNDGDYVYFVHSYFASCDKSNVIATSDYGMEFTASVQKDNVYGCQFHPEKSGEVGMKILKNFCNIK